MEWMHHILCNTKLTRRLVLERRLNASSATAPVRRTTKPMKILLLNPPHPAIGSRIPREHLPPLGLLSVGGPLLDAGHQVKLLDAEFSPMTVKRVVTDAGDYDPDAILIGHSGSTSGH